ncbi:hypothetical protein C8R43DRAFT_79932 [Mycena crocata]|nr:hypothetical protein C8R43DRAFT_79932 [Mycena crocata]
MLVLSRYQSTRHKMRNWSSWTVCLPCLTNLCVRSIYRLRLQWPHAHFLSLPTRSAFATKLICLNLDPFRISEAELLTVLADLPMLERLSIADHPPDTEETTAVDSHRDAPSESHIPLITSSFFAALLRHPDSTSANAAPKHPSHTSSASPASLPFSSTIRCFWSERTIPG